MRHRDDDGHLFKRTAWAGAERRSGTWARLTSERSRDQMCAMGLNTGHAVGALQAYDEALRHRS